MKKKEMEGLGFQQIAKTSYYTREDQGYVFLVQWMKQSMALMTTLPDHKELSTYLDRLVIHQKPIKHAYLQDEECGIIMKRSIKTDEFTKIYGDLLSFLKTHHIKAVCHICHQENPVHVALINDTVELLCDECKQSQPDLHFIKERKNFGLLGAFLFGLVPAVVWGLCHRFGWIICLDGILFALCGYLGYHWLGYKVSLGSLPRLVLASLLSLWIGEVIELVFSIQSAFAASSAKGVTIAEALQVLPAFLFDSEVLGGILAYHFITFILYVLTLFILFQIMKKRPI